MGKTQMQESVTEAATQATAPEAIAEAAEVTTEAPATEAPATEAATEAPATEALVTATLFDLRDPYVIVSSPEDAWLRLGVERKVPLTNWLKSQIDAGYATVNAD